MDRAAGTHDGVETIADSRLQHDAEPVLVATEIDVTIDHAVHGNLALGVDVS
jgi:hypothetical protein